MADAGLIRKLQDEGNVVIDDVQAKPEECKLFMVFWQRLANSGMIFFATPTAERAVEMLGYNPDFVKMTVVEITDDVLVIGQQG